MNDEADKHGKVTVFTIIASLFAGWFGVQNNKNRERDLPTAKLQLYLCRYYFPGVVRAGCLGNRAAGDGDGRQLATAQFFLAKKRGHTPPLLSLRIAQSPVPSCYYCIHMKLYTSSL